ncbi:MAG: hypothetical protein OCU12_06155 [Methanophagales archaeon]|nr:hypothetical protein [Methanophagales archaeon]
MGVRVEMLGGGAAPSEMVIISETGEVTTFGEVVARSGQGSQPGGPGLQQ